MQTTKYEINKAIAEIEFPDYKITMSKSGYAIPISHSKILGADYLEWCWIGPIIERECIFIAPVFDGWEASSINWGIPVKADTPTKAAALCYLKIKGVEL